MTNSLKRWLAFILIAALWTSVVIKSQPPGRGTFWFAWLCCVTSITDWIISMYSTWSRLRVLCWLSGTRIIFSGACVVLSTITSVWICGIMLGAGLIRRGVLTFQPTQLFLCVLLFLVLLKWVVNEIKIQNLIKKRELTAQHVRSQISCTAYWTLYDEETLLFVASENAWSSPSNWDISFQLVLRSASVREINQIQNHEQRFPCVQIMSRINT